MSASRSAARDSHVGHRQVALQGLLRMGGDAVALEMADDAVEPRPVALEIRFARPHGHDGHRPGLVKQRQRVVQGVGHLGKVG
jgi:hypothetical protein